MKNTLTQNLSMIKGIKRFLFLAILLITSQAAFAQANDLCADAEAIACGASVTGSTAAATNTGADANTCGTEASTAPGVWYSFVGDGNANTFSLCAATDFDSKIFAYTGTCGALVCETGNDDDCDTQSEITFTSVVGTDYLIYVTGFGTSSGNYSLDVTCAPPATLPANDLCADAEAIACGASVTGSTAAATNTGADANTCGTGASTAPGVWYSFVGDGNANTFSLCAATDFDSKIFAYTGTCGALVCETGNDDDCGTQSEITFTSVVGTDYLIYVTGFGTSSGNYSLDVTCAPPATLPANDLCADAEAIACGASVTGSTAAATNTGADVNTCGTAATTAPGVWYSFAGDGNIATFSLCAATDFDSKIFAYTGACGALVCETGNDDDCGTQSEITFTSVVGTDYLIYVTGFGTSSGNYSLDVTCMTPPPPPANDLCADAVAITGAGAIDGTNVAGTSTTAPPACGTSGDLNTSAGVWYSYQGDGSSVTVDLCGSSDDTKVGVFSGACDALVCVGGEDDDFTVCGGNDPSVTFTADLGTMYFIYVSSFGTDSEEPFTLNVAVVAPPMAVCQPAAVMLDADGMASVTVADIDGGSTADAGIASLAITAGDTDFTCDDLLTTQTVTLTVTDNNGATSSCDAMVVITDPMPPMAVADDITINILPDETVVVDAAALGVDATDNCSVMSIVITPNSFTQANVGLNMVMITIMDAAGIPTVITANVFVNAFTPLDMVCRQPVSTCNAAGQCGRGDMIILEPYVPDNMNLASLTNDAPDFFPVGTTDIVWSATSVDGLVSQCISQVMISDEEGPVIDCPGNVVKYLAANQCTTTFDLDISATDNCGIESITGNGFQNLPTGLYPIEIVATDLSGNVTTCIANVAVHDITSPELDSCPDDVNVTAPTGSTEVFVNLPQPVITDACGVNLENDAPALFPIGTTTVNWKGNDPYGNWVMCTYDVTVTTAGTVMGAMAPIEASVVDENARVNWNAPSILSFCEACADTDMANYQYLGDYYGHQYFLYTLDAVSLEQAQTLAAAMGGSVVTINTAGENDFLRGQLAGTGQNILVQTEEYDNFPADIIPIEFPETVVMNNDGYWNFANELNTYYFVSEKACVDITQTGPYAEMPNIYGEMETTLLTPGGEWPAGEYVVTYELTDACGASQSHEFDVTVDEAVANYCATGNVATSTDVENVWIENVVMGSFTNGSTQADAGYADYSDLEGLKLIVEEGQTPMTTVELTPGGNTAGELLYWTVWADTNADGDFFDSEALLQVSGVGTVAAEMTIPVAEVYGTKLRVMVSRYEYCQPCANVLIGEAEDYTVTISNATVADTRFGEDDAVKLTTSVYPNPVSEIATLAIGDLPAGYVTVTLMDNLGRTLAVRDYEGMGNERLQFNVSNYASGLLIFKLTQDGEVVGTQRVVKK